MIKTAIAFLKPSIGLFILVTIFCLVFESWLDNHKINHSVLLSANFLLFLLALVSSLLHAKALKNSNAYAFVRSITLGSFIKLIVIAAAVLIYLFKAGENRSIYAVAVAMAIYIVYTVLEVKAAMNLNKNRNAEN